MLTSAAHQEIDPILFYNLESLNAMMALIQAIPTQIEIAAMKDMSMSLEYPKLTNYTVELQNLGTLVNDLMVNFGEAGLECFYEWEGDNELLALLEDSLNRHGALSLKDLAMLGMYVDDPLYRSLPLIENYKQSVELQDVKEMTSMYFSALVKGDDENAKALLNLKKLRVEELKEKYGVNATSYLGYSNKHSLTVEPELSISTSEDSTTWVNPLQSAHSPRRGALCSYPSSEMSHEIYHASETSSEMAATITHHFSSLRISCDSFEKDSFSISPPEKENSSEVPFVMPRLQKHASIRQLRTGPIDKSKRRDRY